MTTVIVVTGAGSGMGRACVEPVRAFADVVVAVDRHAPDLDGVVAVGCDVSDPTQVTALAERVASLGTFRGLVHAAGISQSMDDQRRILEVNLVGTQLLVNAFEPLVVPGSAAVCFASTAAHQLGRFVTAEQRSVLADPLAPDFLDRAAALSPDSGIAYGLSKVGVQFAVRRAAAVWGRLGGRINSLSPGIIDTPMGQFELEHYEVMHTMVERSPVQRMGEPREIAAAVSFLISDAASFITGTDLLVDGGLISLGSAATK